MRRPGGPFPKKDNSQRAKDQKEKLTHSLFVVLSIHFFFFLSGEGEWLTDSNCAQLPCKHTFFSFEEEEEKEEEEEEGRRETHKFFVCFFLQLTGQAKLKGKTILDLSFLTELLKEKVFPPRTGVDPIPKLQGPAAETLDWYSFRQTLKNVSHSSRAHFLPAVFRVPSQHMPLSSSPFTLCIDKICNSNCPVPSDTCWETEEWMQWQNFTSIMCSNKSPPYVICTLQRARWTLFCMRHGYM